MFPDVTAARHASVDDVPRLLALWKRFMTEEPAAVPNANPAEAEKPWTARLLKLIARSKVIVVASHDMVVGFLAFVDSDDCSWVPPGIAYVVDLYVAPDARSTSAARRLFDATAELQPRYSQMWTNTHLRNQQMQMLLKRAGFEPLHDFQIEGLPEQAYYRFDRSARRRNTHGGA